MIIDDIYAALKNALMRGETLEKAKQSLINAGYSEAEIKIAADKITQAGKKAETGTIVPVASSVQTSPFAQTIPQAQAPQSAQGAKEKQIDKKKLIIIIVLSLLGLSIATFLIINFAL